MAETPGKYLLLSIQRPCNMGIDGKDYEIFC